MAAAIRKVGAHVQDGLAKIREQSWAEPLGKGLAKGAEIIKGLDDLVPGGALIGGAMSLGAILLNPDSKSQKRECSAGETRSNFNEIKIEMKSILENIQEHNKVISVELQEMKDVISQTFLLIADVKYRDGIEKLDAAYEVFLAESSNAQFDDFQQFAFELKTIATQHFSSGRVQEYLAIIYEKGGGLKMCQNVMDYFIVVLSKYLQMMVSYNIYKEDSERVATHFENFNKTYEALARIFEDITKKEYKPGCRDFLKNATSNVETVIKVNVATPWDRVLAAVAKKRQEDETHTKVTSLDSPDEIQNQDDNTKETNEEQEKNLRQIEPKTPRTPLEPFVNQDSEEEIERTNLPASITESKIKGENNKETHALADSNPEDRLSQDMTFKQCEDKDSYILVLGKTGIGKSTWINGIANYLQHETLEDAIKAEKVTVLIPSSFDYVASDGKKHKIEMGKQSADEILQPGQSATQMPKEYIFKTGSHSIHFIDTPGIGDVRGIEKDKENFDNILTFLLKFKKINAVCVLMTPNDDRLNAAFRFCVLELLSHLHKSLEQNILFCFTKSRSTFYKPGKTTQLLSKLLKDNNIGIKLEKTRYFCFDNEAFRYLSLLKNNVQIDENEVREYSKSWKITLRTTLELLRRVNDLPPNDTKNTLSLNEARESILALSKPMAETVQVIDLNTQQVESAQREIDCAQGDIAELEKNLKFKGFEIERETLDCPRTVCAHTDCKKFVPVGQSKVTNAVYDVICHKNCKIKGLPTESFKDTRLAECYAFDFDTVEAHAKFFGKDVKEFPDYMVTPCNSEECGDTGFHTHVKYNRKELLKGLSPAKREEYKEQKKAKFTKNCNHCDHSFLLHMHVTYTTKVVEKEFLSPSVQENIRSKEDVKSRNDALKVELTNRIKELEEEKEIIFDCATNFGSFLKKNAMVPYNDAFKAYIDMLIHNEQGRPEHVRDKKRIQKLEKDKKTYDEKKKVLEESVSSSLGNQIILEDIFKMRNILVSLRHNGQALKDALDGILSARQQPNNELIRTVKMPQVTSI